MITTFGSWFVDPATEDLRDWVLYAVALFGVALLALYVFVGRQTSKAVDRELAEAAERRRLEREAAEDADAERVDPWSGRSWSRK